MSEQDFRAGLMAIVGAIVNDVEHAEATGDLSTLYERMQANVTDLYDWCEVWNEEIPTFVP